jgi:hypothetical protein
VAVAVAGVAAVVAVAAVAVLAVAVVAAVVAVVVVVSVVVVAPPHPPRSQATPTVATKPRRPIVLSSLQSQARVLQHEQRDRRLVESNAPTPCMTALILSPVQLSSAVDATDGRMLTGW